MTRAAIIACLAATLCLSACEDKPAGPAKQGGAASGEVLPGSASDAMIPLDQLASEAPLAPRQAVPVGDVDAEQPDVTPAPGINDSPQSTGAEAAPAATAPDASE